MTLTTMSPYKGDTPHLWIDQHYVMNNSDGFYLHILYCYKYRTTYIFLKQIQLALENYTRKKQQGMKYCRCKQTPHTICFSVLYKLFYCRCYSYLFSLIYLKQ